MILRELLTLIGYQVDKKGEQETKQSFDRIKSGARDLARDLGLVFGAGAVVLGFKKTLELASDVEETMNVVTTAFENQADAVLKWAEESGEAAGRSQYAMREYAAVVGAVVGPTLGSAKATADLSTNMAQLAVDLGSFFNATDQEALDALRAGLIGSSEPMLRFGVNMNVAALDAFALSEGIGKTMKQMTEAEKIMLRYRFILARTTKAQGDAEKTAEGFANQVKRLQGNLRDLAVGIGSVFLPQGASALQLLNSIVKTIKGPLISAVRLLVAPFKLIGVLIVGLAYGIYESHIAIKILIGVLLPFLAAWAVALKPILIAHTLLALKFLLIAGLVFILILIIEDLWQAITGGESVIGNVIGEFWRWVDETGGVLAAIGALFVNAIDYWLEKLFGFSNGTERIAFAIQAAFEKAFNFVSDLMLEVVGFISDKVEPIINDIFNLLMKMVGVVSDLGLGDIAATLGLTEPESVAAPGSPLAAKLAGGAAVPAGGRTIETRAGVTQTNTENNVNAPQSIEVNVNAPGGDGPGIAAAVGPAVGNAAAEAYRQTGQQLLLGGATP